MAATVRKHAGELGTHRRERRFPFSRARRRAQPRNRNGGDRHPRRGFSRARARRQAASTGSASANSSRGIDLLHQEGVKHAVMAGQVKHNKIFSSIRPDWRLAKLLFSLPRKNTDSLIGAVARVLARRRHRAGRLHEISRRACFPPKACSRGRAPDAAEIRGHRLRQRDRPPDCRARSGPDGGDPRPRLRGHRSHGRHRRNDRARRAHCRTASGSWS